MTLFEAREPDLKKEKRHTVFIVAAIVIVLLGLFGAWWFRNYPEERVVNRFFDAIERKDYESAYSIWHNDPQWKSNLGKYKDYPYGQFELDWGPSGEYGAITSHKIEGSASPRSSGPVTGVVVVVTVNDRAEPACLWVEKEKKTIGYSPVACQKP